MQLTLSYLALLLYLAASLGYLASLRVSHGKRLRAAGVLARAGFALHTRGPGDPPLSGRPPARQPCRMALLLRLGDSCRVYSHRGTVREQGDRLVRHPSRCPPARDVCRPPQSDREPVPPAEEHRGLGPPDPHAARQRRLRPRLLRGADVPASRASAQIEEPGGSLSSTALPEPPR